MKNCEDITGGATKTMTRVAPAGTTAPTGGAELYRRLKWDELVVRGDFIKDGHQGFELWSGPPGFRADAFVKPIYRRAGTPSVAVKKLK